MKTRERGTRLGWRLDSKGMGGVWAEPLFNESKAMG